jgi:hypothetical protein
VGVPMAARPVGAVYRIGPRVGCEPHGRRNTRSVRLDAVFVRASWVSAWVSPSGGTHPRAGGFSPIPFFYVMGGSLVFVFLTWHIPSLAGSMMAGAVSLSLTDAAYPAVLEGRVAGAGVVAAGTAVMGAGRWAIDRLRVHTSLHAVTAEPPRAQPPGEPATVTPARPSDAGRSPGDSGSVQAKGAPPARTKQEPGASSTSRDTPPPGPAQEQMTGRRTRRLTPSL